MNGIYALLAWLPLGATTFLLYGLTLGMIFFLRDTKEGLFYNTSYSAMIGDGALLAVVVSAIGILKQGGMPPAWLAPDTQFTLACISIIFGVAWCLRDRPKYSADRYHHLVIAPMLLFLLLTLVPVILKNGTVGDVVMIPIFIGLWAVLVVFDAKNKRLDQPKYLREHSIVLPGHATLPHPTICSECGSNMVWDLGYWSCRKCGATIGPSGRT